MNSEQSDPMNMSMNRMALAAGMSAQEIIDSNLAAAHNEFPEFFGEICMLYIDVKVNGTPI